MTDRQADAPADDLDPVRGFLRARFGGGAEIVGAERVGTASRNRLVRIALAQGSEPRTLIVKSTSKHSDVHFAHHLRREERLLDLLARFAPGLAPRCVGLILDPAERGWLILEDVGGESLADRLAGREPSAGVTELEAALARVRDLHHALREQRAPFYRTCFAIDLDRFTAQSLTSRFIVAWRRLAGIAGSMPDPPPAARRAWSAQMAPLLAAPRQMIHNSLSPLNVVVDPRAGPRIVDLETMTLGPACIDVAELLRQPFGPIDWETTARLASVADADLRALRLAALARSLDYAGSNARQIRQDDTGQGPVHAGLRRRLRWYCDEARELLEGLACLRPLGDLLAAVVNGA